LATTDRTTCWAKVAWRERNFMKKVVEEQGWVRSPESKDAPERQNENNGPRQQSASLSQEADNNHEPYHRVELRTVIASGKQRNAQQDPICDYQREDCKANNQSYIASWTIKDWTLWRGQSPPKWKERLHME
jgi:hypothetical protein